MLYSQCVTNVDFSTWQEGGWAANGNWVVTGGGSQVHQTVNGNPSFFYSPYTLMNARISGDFRTTNSDDDYMGFVFSFLDPLGQSDNFNCWLYDWKQGTQTSSGYVGQVGMSLNRINGVIPSSSYPQTFWGHQNTPQFSCVANNFGSAGWVRNQTHHFELFVTFTRAMIYIDNVLVFDHADCYWPGRFGFYNYSQADCYYSNFQYSLYVDYTNLTPKVCTGDTAKFQFINPCINLNFLLTQYESLVWNYGDGTSDTILTPSVNSANTTHIYNTPGTYNVTLRVTDSQGCTDTAMHTVTVTAPPVAAFTTSPPCTGTSVNFTDNSSGTGGQWQWYFGDGDSAVTQNTAHVYASTGLYDVVFIATDTNGCRDTVTSAITVSAPPVADFSTAPVCEQTASVFTDASTNAPAQWQWYFGDGNSSTQQNAQHIYSTSGTYNAMLIATSALQCADTAIQQVIVYPKPVSAFSTANVCYGNSATFTNQSTGNITTYVWDFGDNQQSQQPNPTHFYSSDGSYTVTLFSATADGCADTATDPITIYPKPVAAFTAPDVCEGFATQYTDNSSIASGNIISYLWDFGDNSTTAITQNTSHTYTVAGTYNTTLLIESNYNCSDTLIQQVVVHPNPTAIYTTGNACFGSPVQFNSQSTGNITGYHYNFGDGQTSALPSPVYYYSSAGNYNTSLIVTTNAGCADTATTQAVTIHPKPQADFTVAAVCSGVTSAFTDNSALTSGSIISYNWAFGDGNTSTQQNPANQYSTDGTYPVTLIVVTDSLCSDTITQPAIVHPLPQPDFSTPAVCLNQLMAFSNTSTINSGSINQWWWDLGDGNTGTVQSPVYTYTAQGTYTVKLIATSDNNCVDSIQNTVTVFDKPVADFTVTEVCAGQATAFTDNSTIGNGSITQWNYNYGDSQTGVQPSPQYTYAQYGNYTAVLVVTSDNNCTDTVSVPVTVNPLPVTAFTVANVCLGASSNFSNTSTIPVGSISAYTWDLGDGNTATGTAATNTYTAVGTYAVTLTATSDKGCVQTSSSTTEVYAIPVAAATSTPACYQQDNGSATVQVTNGTPPYTYNWSNSATANTATGLYAGNYPVTVTDANQCTASAAASVTEPAIPLTVTAAPANPTIKLNDLVSITLTNSYNDGAAQYEVSPGYGLNCTTCATFDAQPYQTTEYYITVTDSLGCTGTGRITVTVDQALPLFIPNVFTPNGDGANDTWSVISQAVKLFSLKVFNRWGEKVFESESTSQSWDGTYQGQPLPPGTYTYQGNIVYLNNNTLPLKGTVTLLR
jgi:gliding motility-associated-like protein